MAKKINVSSYTGGEPKKVVQVEIHWWLKLLQWTNIREEVTKHIEVKVDKSLDKPLNICYYDYSDS